MSKKLLPISIIFLLISSCFLVIPVTSKINANDFTSDIIYVGGIGNNNYTKIQDAINAANIGDTIFVYNGNYKENLTINKSINLVGENAEETNILGERSVTTDGVIVKLKQREFIINITADNINLCNFSIIGFTEEMNSYGYLENTINGIIINNCSSIKISDINIDCTTNSINIKNSTNISIIKSTFGITKNGIKVKDSSNLIISKNSFTLNGYCINAINLIDSIVSKNNFYWNLKAVNYKISFDKIRNRTIWMENYWLRSRLTPKPIIAKIMFNRFEIFFIFFDKKPLLNSYPE